MGGTAVISIVENRQVAGVRPNFVHKTKQSLFDFVRTRMERQGWQLARDHQGSRAYRSGNGVLSPLGSLIPSNTYSPWLEILPCYNRIFWHDLRLFAPEHLALVEDMEIVHQIATNSDDFQALFIGIGMMFNYKMEDV